MNTLRTGILMAALTGLFLAMGFALGGGPGMTIAFVFAGLTNLWAYWNSDKALLAMYGAREVGEAEAPGLVPLVRQLSAQAGLPMPKVYVVENDQPNAFATGRDPKHAAVCVTRGLLASVSDEELAGVLAHELGHIRHRDTLFLTIVALVAGTLPMLAAMLTRATASHGREFAADRASAEISGHPLWLASALEHVGRTGGCAASHPSTEDRVARLHALAGRLT